MTKLEKYFYYLFVGFFFLIWQKIALSTEKLIAFLNCVSLAGFWPIWIHDKKKSIHYLASTTISQVLTSILFLKNESFFCVFTMDLISHWAPSWTRGIDFNKFYYTIPYIHVMELLLKVLFKLPIWSFGSI